MLKDKLRLYRAILSAIPHPLNAPRYNGRPSPLNVGDKKVEPLPSASSVPMNWLFGRKLRARFFDDSRITSANPWGNFFSQYIRD